MGRVLLEEPMIQDIIVSDHLFQRTYGYLQNCGEKKVQTQRGI